MGRGDGVGCVVLISMRLGVLGLWSDVGGLSVSFISREMTSDEV